MVLNNTVDHTEVYFVFLIIRFELKMCSVLEYAIFSSICLTNITAVL